MLKNNNKSLNPGSASIQTINIHPSDSIILTDELDLVTLLAAFKISSSDVASLNLNFINLAGIELTQWSTGPSPSISFQKSQIRFYINGTRMENLKCSKGLINGTSTFFNTFSTVVFYDDKNKYPDQPVCPFIFSNAELAYFTIMNQTKNNLFRFQSVNESTINSNIQQLVVQGVGFVLDTGLMHPLVFQHTKQIQVLDSVASVQTDLFKHFAKIVSVDLLLHNLKTFFHQIGIEWTFHLPNRTVVAFATTSDQPTQTTYTYPDEDFCLFANWPHSKRIIPVLDDSAGLSNCTSTIRWFLFNYFKHDLSRTVLADYSSAELVYSVCKKSEWTKIFASDPAYFDKKISACSVNVSTKAIRTTIANTTSQASTTSATSTVATTSTVSKASVFSTVATTGTVGKASTGSPRNNSSHDFQSQTKNRYLLFASILVTIKKKLIYLLTSTFGEVNFK
jgi:hypothetical protein